MNKTFKPIILVGIIILLVMIMMTIMDTDENDRIINYSEFIQKVEKNEIKRVTIKNGKSILIFKSSKEDIQEEDGLLVKRRKKIPMIMKQ